MLLLTIAISLIAVSLGAELLVRSSSILALRAGLSPLFIGLTIIGFGTSSPELGASISASLQGVDGIVLGNVIGSNIFNVMFVLGLIAVICPIKAQIEAIRKDLIFVIFISLLPFISIFFDGEISRSVGIALVVGLLLFLTRAYIVGRKSEKANEILKTEIKETLVIPRSSYGFLNSIFFNGLLVIISFIFLIYGSQSFVNSSVELARSVGVSELVIGLTIVAIGTSLPELVTSLVAIKKGNVDMAIGNVIGSNIFNLMGILGISAIIKSQTVDTQVLYIDTPVMFVATLALLPIIKTGGVISRLEGSCLLLSYLGYVGYLVWLA